MVAQAAHQEILHMFGRDLQKELVHFNSRYILSLRLAVHQLGKLEETLPSEAQYSGSSTGEFAFEIRMIRLKPMIFKPGSRALSVCRICSREMMVSTVSWLMREEIRLP